MKYPLVESLALEDGKIKNTAYHIARFEKSYYELYHHQPNYGLLDNVEEQLPATGYYKIRIPYNETTKALEYAPYLMTEIRSLKCLVDNTIDYHLKKTERSDLNQLFALRGTCDDILIIKNGLVTDTYAGNIIFKSGSEWFTPNTPLLQGTQRAYLLDQGLIKTASIRQLDIHNFSHFMVINTMRPLDRSTPVKTSYIK